MVDYAGAIKKPLSDMQTLGISTVMGAIPIVNILMWFFGVENAKRVLNKNASLPSWNADVIFSNIVPALKMLVVGIVYLIPGLVVAGIGLVPIIGGIIAGITSGDTSTLLAGLAAGGIIALVGVLLMLIGAVLSSMGTYMTLKTGSIGAGFNIGAILKKVFTATYWISLIVYFIYVIVIGIAAGIISGILLVIPVLGFFLGLLVSGLAMYLTSITCTTIIAGIFNETP